MKVNIRPCITIASTDKELLVYIQTLTGGTISNKKNYKPDRHKDSYTLNVKKKENVLLILKHVSPYLRVEKKEIAHYGYSKIMKQLLHATENITQNY